jgi:hypothetical protein
MHSDTIEFSCAAVNIESSQCTFGRDFSLSLDSSVSTYPTHYNSSAPSQVKSFYHVTVHHTYHTKLAITPV